MTRLADAHPPTPPCARSLRRALLLVPLLALACLFAGHASAQAAPDAPEGAAPTRCLPGDPYDLDALIAALETTTPSSAPITVGPQIVVRFVGTATIVDPGDQDPAPEPEDDPPATGGPSNPTEPPAEGLTPGTLALRVVNSTTRNEFEISLGGPMLKAINDCHIANERNAATQGVEDPGLIEDSLRQFLPLVGGGGGPTFRGLTPVALSDGVDTRIIRTPTTTWPWRAISHFSNNCTGTLIGSRHVITVAHCIYSRTTNTWSGFTVRPGRDDAVIPYGSSTITVNLPAGQTGWYFTWPQWRNPAQTGANRWDWGMVVIPHKLGNQTGAMGYVALPASQIALNTRLNRGYPVCTGNRTDIPEDCEPRRLYGDTKGCAIGLYAEPDANNWNRHIYHNCDTSAGHSGSPFYQYRYFPQHDITAPVVVGVHFGSTCDRDIDGDGTVEASEQCDANDDFPSIVRRNTPDELWVISFLKEMFPD